MASSTLKCFVTLTNGSDIVSLTPDQAGNNGVSLAAPNVIEDMQLVAQDPINATRFVKGSLSTTTLQLQEPWAGQTLTGVAVRISTSGAAVANLTQAVRDLINTKAAEGTALTTAVTQAQASAEAAAVSAGSIGTQLDNLDIQVGAAQAAAVLSADKAEIATDKALEAVTAATTAGEAAAEVQAIETDIHTNWQVKLDSAAAAAATAVAAAGAAGVSTAGAAASALAAQSAKTQAESARDAALIQSGVYATEALGRAAVADGGAFKVQGSGDVAAYEYRRTNSTTSVLIATYPSKSAIDAMKVDVYQAGRNLYTNATFAKDALGVLAEGVAPTGFSVNKSGSPSAVFPASALVTKTNKPLRTTKVLELTHASTSTTFTDYQLTKSFPIPPVFAGDAGAKARLVFLVNHEVAGLSALAYAGLVGSAGQDIGAAPVTKVSADGAPGEWFYAVFDISINNAAAASVRMSVRSQAAMGPTVNGRAWIGGVFFDFDRPNWISFDRNITEEITDLATSIAGTTAAAAVVPISNRITALEGLPSLITPWKQGANPTINPLLTVDAVGHAGVPTGYLNTAAGGVNAVAAPYSIQAAVTPFGTDKAWTSTHYYDGMNKTDIQLYHRYDIPEQYWGNVGTKFRFIYSGWASDARVLFSAAGQFQDAAGVDLGALTVTTVQGTTASNSWVTCIFDVTITNASARKIRICARPQASSTGGVFYGATAKVTGFWAGFNLQNQVAFDRNLNYEADMLAKARVDALRVELAAVTPRNIVGQYDQYQDARGNLLPILPNAVINCFGDSLTAAEYPGKLSTLLASQSRTVNNCGIGGETSIDILNRIEGHEANTTGVTWVNGTIRLKTKRTVPWRETQETYRANWSSFGIAIGEPSKVEFFNSTGLIGSSRNQLKAVATVSGSTLSAAAHPFANGDEVYHLGTLPTGMYTGKVYYVRDVTADTYALAEFAGGAAVGFGSGTVSTLGPFYLDWDYAGQDHTITTVTHTDKDLSTQVLWLGANNIASTQQVMDDIRAAIAHIKTFSKRFIVMTVLPNDSYLPATAAGISLAAVNAWILSEYPNNSVDALGYLKSKHNPALPQDVTDVANNITPTSLRVDAIHLTAAGYQHVADLVYSALVSKGW